MLPLSTTQVFVRQVQGLGLQAVNNALSVSQAVTTTQLSRMQQDVEAVKAALDLGAAAKR